MDQIGTKIKQWYDYTATRINKWVRGMDSMLGEALTEWMEQEKRVIAFRKQTRIVEEQLRRHDLVIDELIKRLHDQHEQKGAIFLEQQTSFQQKLRRNLEQIEILHRQLREKEEIVAKSRMAIQQLMFKIDESKHLEQNLETILENQKKQLTELNSEKQKLETKISELQSTLTQSESEDIELLKDQLKRAMKRVLEIKQQEYIMVKQNASYEEEIKKVQREKNVLIEQMGQMEQVRETLQTEKQELLTESLSQEKEIQLILHRNEELQNQLIYIQRNEQEMFELLDKEQKKQNELRLEKLETDRKYDKLVAQWSAKRKEYEKKEERLEKRLGRRIGNSIPHIFVEPEFEKDYMELSEDERTGVDAALYELSLGWHTGNAQFRLNKVKGKNNSFLEYGWGASHRIPGRLYVRQEEKGYRIYRISRTKEGGHHLNQKRVIDWLKKQ